jgi:hypothetical protein
MRHQIESDDIANIMASFADDAGSLGRATRAVVALPERVDKDNSRLIWLPRGKVVPIDTRDLGDLVYRFLRLTDSDEAILEFARKFGPLWICRRHDVAAYHPPTLFMPGALGPGPTGNDDMGLKPVFDYNCLPEKLKDGRWAESLGTWRRFSLRAKSVLAIAARLKAGKDISKEEWRAVDGFDWDWEKWGAWVSSRSLVAAGRNPKLVVGDRSGATLRDGAQQLAPRIDRHTKGLKTYSQRSVGYRSSVDFRLSASKRLRNLLGLRPSFPA